MNEKFKNIIDSHVHLDLIARDHPHRIQWLKENYCTVVSWSYFDEIDTVEKLAEGLKSKAMCIKRLSSTVWTAIILPVSIPDAYRRI